ncbi:hypothetical protein Hamer_G022901 [Homarus americanus]|uniref:Uncharacterized protein n=1 Tax=Homarus americanus TaxID=6706 RepID=A0A8J5MZ32_HOMAM|nr:hypothetical protein Hamer_G022901 [Homarus americanus]
MLEALLQCPAATSVLFQINDWSLALWMWRTRLERQGGSRLVSMPTLIFSGPSDFLVENRCRNFSSLQLFIVDVDFEPYIAHVECSKTLWSSSDNTYFSPN